MFSLFPSNIKRYYLVILKGEKRIMSVRTYIEYFVSDKLSRAPYKHNLYTPLSYKYFFFFYVIISASVMMKSNEFLF